VKYFVAFVLGWLLATHPVAAAPVLRGPAPVARRVPVAPDTSRRHRWLYIGSDRDSVVTAYDLDESGFPLVRTITHGIDSPGGIALDAKGVLYVPNQHAGTITEYVPGSGRPALTLTGTDQPQGVAIDAAGDVYVCNRGSDPGISVYPAGQTTPSEHITSPLIKVPNQLAFDASGTLYISDNETGVSILPPGPSQQVVSLGLRGLYAQTSGLALDTVNGALFVSNAVEGPYYVSLYGAGQLTPKRSRLVNFGGLDFLAVGMMDGREHVFVPDSLGDVVYIYKHGLRGTPDVLTTASGYVAVGVAFKPAGVP
jgi:DNA-binding beta-propeller fold protein YncE